MTSGEGRQLTLSPSAAGVVRARRFVRGELEAAGADTDALDIAELLVSELVTNVVLHARTDAVVTVHPTADGAYRVSVQDSSAARLNRRSYGREQSTGRGLRLLSVLSRSWGVEPAADGAAGGKLVWFEVPAEEVSMEQATAAYDIGDDAEVSA